MTILTFFLIGICAFFLGFVLGEMKGRTNGTNCIINLTNKIQALDGVSNVSIRKIDEDYFKVIVELTTLEDYYLNHKLNQIEMELIDDYPSYRFDFDIDFKEHAFSRYE